MNVFELRDGFGLENVKAAQRETPKLHPGEVLVRLRAASLNHRDLLIVEGTYNPKLKLPRIPLSDGAGEVVALGAEVTEWKIGDRVVLPFFPGWREGNLTAEKAATALGDQVDGVLREFVAIAADCLLPIPDHLDFVQAAALPCAAVTAWNGLFVAGTLRPGQNLLLQGTGGVSLFGLQLARAVGAKIILLSSSDAKLARARELGADLTLNYRETPEWGRKVLEMTGGEGVDVTLEVGGAGTLSQTLRATRYGGRINMIGALTGLSGEISLGLVLHKTITISGIFVGSGAMFADLNRALIEHRISPVIDRVFEFDDGISAFHYLKTGRHLGKVCVRFP